MRFYWNFSNIHTPLKVYSIYEKKCIICCIFTLHLKVTHVLKLNKFSIVHMSDEVKTLVVDVGPFLLVDCLFTMIDTQLLVVFVECQHKETSSFHLLFGEMMITLDGVSSFFHLPFASNFFTPMLMNQEITSMTTETYLGVMRGMIFKKLKANKGSHFCLS